MEVSVPMKEVESETILTKFIETRKNLGMKGKLKMKPLLGNLHSSFSKLDDIAQKVFTGINTNETLEKIKAGNHLDAKLYEFAQSLFFQRYEDYKKSR